LNSEIRNPLAAPPRWKEAVAASPARRANAMSHIELTDDEYAKFCWLIYRTSGIRIADNKRVMVGNRVRRRLRATGIASFREYYVFLTSPAGAGEMPQFLDEITTNETYFFRDMQHYQWLGNEFLPEIARLAALRKHPRRLRLWSAACSTGEEPYSMAIEILEKRLIFAGWNIKVVGTDLSGAVLADARAGRYDARAVRHVVPARRLAFFDEDTVAGRWNVKPDVKAMVTWKLHNLLSPLKDDPFDCIFIKNVLIYFDKDSKQVVVKNLIEALAGGGYLVVGPTEGVYNMLDSLVKVKPWLYQKPGA
jgi:chemotaxis protein methyltransferase CheR